MLFAVKAIYIKGCRLTDAEILATKPVVGELMLYRCPKAPGEELRTMAGVSTPGKSDLLKPILEPRLAHIGLEIFVLRGLEEFKTDRGWIYTLQEWYVGQRPEAGFPR